MILSIGMIVKNEEKYLERCLTAIKPILDNIDSELIIADTGSTDSTVEIARRFTDNVFHFEWVNDFAAARNSTLRRAKGEWYMFIDADEILQDCSDIIKFFNSNEYRKYNSASFVVRSYAEKDKWDVYSDFRAYRLTVIREDVTFENPVHEALVPPIAPCRNLDLIADHFGYMYYTNGVLNELAKEKSERNLKVLFEELEEQKISGNIRATLYNQIADCYELLNMPEKAFEYVEMGIQNVDPRTAAAIMYYNHKFSLLLNLKRYEEAIALTFKYFSKENPARTKQLTSDCYAYAVRGIASFNINNYEQTIASFVSCFNLYNKYINNKLVTEDLMMGSFKVTKPFIKICYDLFYKCCIHEHRYEAANDVSKLFPITDYLADRDYMLTHLLLRLEIMEHTSYSKLSDLYYKLDDYNKKQLIRITRWHLFKTGKHEQILKKMNDIVKGNQYLEDTLELFRRYYVGHDLTWEFVAEYLSKYTARENEDVWCLMLLADYDITPYITDFNFNSEQCTRGVYLNYLDSFDAAELFADYNINALSSNGLEKAASVYGWAMIGAVQNNLDVTRLFEKFGEIGSRWHECYPNLKNVPGDVKAAMMVNDIVYARKNGDYERCIDEMRRLATICPPLAQIINEYRQTVEFEARKAAPKVPTEFEMLAAQVKKNVREMMEAGELAEAENTLLELEELCPLDPEIEKLKDEIYELKR